jgi:hypothetical protein
LAASKVITQVSTEDRARIGVLQKTIRDMEGQLASIIGNHADTKDPMVAPLDPIDDNARAALSVRVVSNQATNAMVGVIYIDPPGICYPWPPFSEEPSFIR